MIVLDSGGLSRLAERSSRAAALLTALRQGGHWPPLVPTPVLVESLQGHAARDAKTNRLLKTCNIIDEVPEPLARRAAALRTKCGRGSAVDAPVVAFAEPGCAVLTSDPKDLRALAAHADDVLVLEV